VAKVLLDGSSLSEWSQLFAFRLRPFDDLGQVEAQQVPDLPVRDTPLVLHHVESADLIQSDAETNESTRMNLS